MKRKIYLGSVMLAMVGALLFSPIGVPQVLRQQAYANELEESYKDGVPKISDAEGLVLAMKEQADLLNGKYELYIRSDIDVAECSQNVILVDLEEIQWVYNYSIDSNGKEISQEFNLYEFDITYRDDFKAIRVMNDEGLADKLTEREAQVLEKALEVAEEIFDSEMSDYDKVLAAHDYLVLNGRYDTRVNGKDLPVSSRRAEGILLTGLGVCSSYASSVKLLLEIAGVECVFVVGDAINSKGVVEAHAWNKVKIDGAWYNIDSTWDDPVPDVPGEVGYKYFNVTDEYLSKDHAWIVENYPQLADSLEYNYYVYNGFVVTGYEMFKEAVTEALEKTGDEKETTVRFFVQGHDGDYDLQFIYKTFSDISAISYSAPSGAEGEFVITVTR